MLPVMDQSPEQPQSQMLQYKAKAKMVYKLDPELFPMETQELPAVRALYS